MLIMIDLFVVWFDSLLFLFFRLRSEGMKLYISDNKVILTEGFDGVVPVKYFEKIESWPNIQPIKFWSCEPNEKWFFFFFPFPLLSWCHSLLDHQMKNVYLGLFIYKKKLLLLLATPNLHIMFFLLQKPVSLLLSLILLLGNVVVFFL